MEHVQVDASKGHEGGKGSVEESVSGLDDDFEGPRMF